MTFDWTRFTRARRQLVPLVKLDSRALAKQQMRGIVRRCVDLTPPSQGKANNAAKKRGEALIAADCARIFQPASEAVIRDIIGFQGRSAKSQYGHKGAKALGEIETRVLSRGEMAAWHAARRRGDGRVMQVNRDVTTGHRKRDLRGLDTGVVRSADFAWFVKLLQKNVGVLASGWNAAAQKLGVRVPSWIARHGTSGGSFEMRETSRGFSIIARNSVDFVDNVRGLRRRVQAAINYQACAMERQLAVLIKKAARRAGFRSR